MSTMQPPSGAPQQEQPQQPLQEPEQPMRDSAAPPYDILSSVPRLPEERDSTHPVFIGLMVVMGLLVAIGLLLRVWTGSSLPLEVALYLILAIVIGEGIYLWIASRPSHNRKRNPIG